MINYFDRVKLINLTEYSEMKIGERKIWQQAAGDTDRNYVDICLKWDMILNGPASFGRWIKGECDPNLTPKKRTDIKRFCEEMEESDLVVLRLGTNHVYAVGEIVGDYEFHEEFNDIDGWDIGHVRRVRWLWRYKNGPKKFPIYTLKFGDTTQVLDKSKSHLVIEWMESLHVSDSVDTPKLKEFASTIGHARNIKVEEISDFLFDKGVASASILSLLNEIGELIRIANWYYRGNQSPSENETVNYLVVPLLRALGWTPQRMAIEWNKIDLALFSGLPRSEDRLSVVIEAKKKDSSCLSAFPQARSYALEKKNCKRIIVSDGLRYGVFKRNSGDSDEPQDFSLHAYLNLTRLRNEYPLYECKGAKDALLSMTPDLQ